MDTVLRLCQQSICIPQPSLTEENVPDQTGKVHIVTGGYSGVGHELVKILYSKNATVYSAGRSRDKAVKSIEAIKATYPDSNGRLYFLSVDLSNFSTIRKAAEVFMSKETRLDVLTNNAGVMIPPRGSRDAQGYELQISTNCLGPFLFTSFLILVLKKTAASSTPGTVRITWAASCATELAPKGGIQFEPDGSVTIHDNPQKDYCQSKAGNVLLAFETARRYKCDGIISVAWNPGNLQSDLLRHMSPIPRWVMKKTLLHAPLFGAYTVLYAGWSGDITQETNGAYIIPWGRFGKLRADLEAELVRTEESGSGTAARFWEWCVRTTKPYV